MTTFLQRLYGVNMSLNDERAFAPNPALYGPTASGQVVSQQTALKISTFWACIDLLASSAGMLPAVLFEYMPNDERRRAKEEPLYEVLHKSPNKKQTPFQFKQMMTAWAIMRKKSYAEIIQGPRGPVDQLIPLHPDRVREEELPDGGVRYIYTEKNKGPRTILAEDMFTLQRYNLDGTATLDLVTYARESLGLSLAAQQASARMFGNDSRPVGALKMPGKLSKEGKKALKESWEAAQSSGRYGSVAVLEEGLEWQKIGIDPKEAQFFEREEFQASDICRWLRVAPTMVGIPGTTMWGSGVEQLGQYFVTYTLGPLLKSWEQSISRDLIIKDERFFVEFIVDALLRGDTMQRFSAYQIASGGKPWLKPNEIRHIENLPPDEDFDKAAPAPVPAPIPAPTEPEPEESAPPAENNESANVFLVDAAARVVRKEITAMNKAANKYSGDSLAIEIQKFYQGHVPFVSDVMHVSETMAITYCATSQTELMQSGPECMADWETRRVGELVRMVKNG